MRSAVGMSIVADDQAKKPLNLAVLPPQMVAQRYVPLMQSHLDRLRKAYDHPNRVLHYDTVLIALLLSFFDPVARSLRVIEDASRDRKSTRLNYSHAHI